MEVSLPADAAPHASAIPLLLAFVAKKEGTKPKISCKRGQAALSARVGDGQPLTGVNTICKAIAELAAPELLGSSPDEAATVRPFKRGAMAWHQC